MKIIPDKRLFLFLKDGIELDLNNPSNLDTYVQQVITHGKANDVKQLLKIVKPLELKESINRLKGFLPNEVERFWEDFIGSTFRSSKRNP